MDEFHRRRSYYVPAHLERAGSVQPERQQRLQRRAPARLQQRRAADRVRHRDAARPRRLGRARRIHGAAQQLRRPRGSTRSAAPPTAAPASTARRSAACGTRCSAKAATSGSSRAPTGTTAACSVPTTAARRQDFFPGEYQRNYTLVHRSATRSSTPQTDRRRPAHRQQLREQRSADRSPRVRRLRGSEARPARHRRRSAAPARGGGGGRQHRRRSCRAARRWARSSWCRPGADVVVAIVVRDPAGTNYSPYTFPNPSLLQIGIKQPLNKPVLDHVDVIRGMVTGYNGRRAHRTTRASGRATGCRSTAPAPSPLSRISRRCPTRRRTTPPT